MWRSEDEAIVAGIAAEFNQGSDGWFLGVYSDDRCMLLQQLL